MKREAEENADADNKAKEKIETLNKADSMVFETEKQLKEFGDKLPEDKKSEIEKALNDLKEAQKSEDADAINTALDALNAIWQQASQDLYKAQQEAQANGQAPNVDAEAPNTEQSATGEAEDVEFEEVNEDKK